MWLLGTVLQLFWKVLDSFARSFDSDQSIDSRILYGFLLPSYTLWTLPRIRRLWPTFHLFNVKKAPEIERQRLQCLSNPRVRSCNRIPASSMVALHCCIRGMLIINSIPIMSAPSFPLRCPLCYCPRHSSCSRAHKPSSIALADGQALWSFRTPFAVVPAFIKAAYSLCTHMRLLARHFCAFFPRFVP
jgi:hypothetical protein